MVSATLFFEQSLNGIQFGLMLFLLAAGLTLVFGIMDMINLAHGSFYMLGAFITAMLVQVTGSFLVAFPLALLATAVLGMITEMLVLRHLYQRDHMSQVLATFGLILVFNELVRIIWGPHAILLNVPQSLSGPVNLFRGVDYSAYRILIIGVGLLVAIGMFYMVNRTRLGMLIRAGASKREMATALGVNIKMLFTLVFGVGAALCAVAGALLGPLLSVQVGMGESIIILVFVVVVIGGIGSIRGALVSAILVGIVDTVGRAFLPVVLRTLFSDSLADNLGPALASISIYLLMAVILVWKPQGLFPAHG